MANETRGPAQGSDNRQNTAPVVQAGSISEQFTSDVLRGFAGSIGAPQVSDYQKRLIQSYFIGIDRALAEAESKRTNENRPPVWWSNVNMPALIIDVVDCARMGLDMGQENHLYAIPYYNERTKLYDVTLMTGYVGIQYIAMKYAVEQPDNVTLQLVYENDRFQAIMRDADNAVESYRFEITNPFDRGKLIGGFGYIAYKDPEKNQLIMMSKAQMDKRKPERASRNFWGNWVDEMYLKTLARHVYSPKFIPRDPMKIDDSYQHMKLREARIAELEAEAAVRENANREIIDTTPDPLPVNAAPGLPESRSVSIPVEAFTGAAAARPDPVPTAVVQSAETAQAAARPATVSAPSAAFGGGGIPGTVVTDGPDF